MAVVGILVVMAAVPVVVVVVTIVVVVGGGGVEGGLVSFWLVGQHRTAGPPRQKPFFTAAPRHWCVLVSMHMPGLL